MNLTSLTFSNQLRAYEAAQEWAYQQALERQEDREAAIAERAAPHYARMSRSPDIADVTDAIDELTDADLARIVNNWHADHATFGQLMREMFLACFERVTYAAAEARQDRIEQHIERHGEEPFSDTGADALTHLERRLASHQEGLK